MSDHVYDPDGTHVWMHNPDTGGVWACPVDVADYFEGRGWVYSDEAAPTADNLVDPIVSGYDGPGAILEGGAVQTGFDPAQHTVAEINDYFAGLGGESQGEVDRVLVLERAGQNRKTVQGNDPDAVVVDPTAESF